MYVSSYTPQNLMYLSKTAGLPGRFVNRPVKLHLFYILLVIKQNHSFENDEIKLYIYTYIYIPRRSKTCSLS